MQLGVRARVKGCPDQVPSAYLDVMVSYGFIDSRVMKTPDYQGKRLPNIVRPIGVLYVTCDFENAVSGANRFRVGTAFVPLANDRGITIAAMIGRDTPRPIYFWFILSMLCSQLSFSDLKAILDKASDTPNGSNNLSNPIFEAFNEVLSGKVDF
ncbi:hypothetical protein [Thalassospira sp. MCCC 1A01428]|uniref:hypothetical protein n=1 Tax=Thalassospira sp. MCCC 1A01428 TaxID=1470575 RepID=UPI000A1E704B|nr:hypothetical protein [Thalassospira sp. MCCC 1A01428]OSQ44788.1 hypothetical protein THS27_06445 [Thalassospira sp. MCCC 1A01428]